MSTEHHRACAYLDRPLCGRSHAGLTQAPEPGLGAPSPKVPNEPCCTLDTLERRWQVVKARPESRAALTDPQTLGQMKAYQHNIENFIGSVKLPVGLAGPLRVNGRFARGDYYLPLATTEAALVASYNRGAQLISEAGGCTAMLVHDGLGRAPGFAFADLHEVGFFLAWASSQMPEFMRAAEATTRHGQLTEMRITVEGNHVYMHFEFTTGDACGQNMVTIATEAICAYIEAHAPVRPQYSFLETNLSGDKKASARSFILGRGKQVTAEAVLPADLVVARLHTTPEQMTNYWRMAAIGGVLSGSVGVQGHYANGLAALYLACGQDVACVAESAVGVTRFEVTARGDLYAAVTLPNLMVGTVGGGTGLSSQQACLDILGLAGPGNAPALAEVCAGLCLAGELSIAGALCAGEFACAHQRLARGKPRSAPAEVIAHG